VVQNWAAVKQTSRCLLALLLAFFTAFGCAGKTYAEEMPASIGISEFNSPPEITVIAGNSVSFTVSWRLVNLDPEFPIALYSLGIFLSGDIFWNQTDDYHCHRASLTTLEGETNIYLEQLEEFFPESGMYYLILAVWYEAEGLRLHTEEFSPLLVRFPDLDIANDAGTITGFAEGPDSESTFGAEDSLTLTMSVTNCGNAAIAGLFWEDQLWASVDDTYDNSTDRIITGRLHSGTETLLPGASYTDTLSVYVPDLIANGEKYLIFKLDTGGSIYESEEANEYCITLPPVAYALTTGVYPPEGGEISTPPGRYIRYPGTTFEITATPAPGYDFLFWGGCPEIAGLENPTVSVTLDGNKIVNAFFASQAYALTLNTNGGGTINPVAGSHVYPRGSEITLTAVPDPGNAFQQWTGDVWAIIGDASAPVVSVAMNCDLNLTANFAPLNTSIEGILQFPGDYEGQTVTISGTYRGWETNFGSPPLTRSDWILQDAGGYAIFVTGGSLGLKHPVDIGTVVQITVIVRIIDDVPYLELVRNRR